MIAELTRNISSRIIFAVIAGAPFALIIADFVFFIKKKKNAIFEIIAFLIGSAYMCFAYSIWDLPPYSSSINIYGTESAHEPVNTQYAAALVLFALTGFISYLFLKYCKKKFPPLLEVVLLGGMYVGMLLCVVFIMQLILDVHPQPADMSALTETLEVDYLKNWKVSLNAFDYLIILFLCIVPVLFIIHCIDLMVIMMKEKAQEQCDKTYESQLMNKLNHLFVNGMGKYFIAILAMLPVMAVLSLVLTLFGQQPDSIILAFTQTSDWILSKEISPPPVAYDTHYLCTVSLRGHKRLVKPIRYGIRRGEKIVVNRQLCVANAFEQVIQERTPKLHKLIRNFYDTYGYPVSKHINTAFAADIVYIIMKPLEWIFIITLYLVERNPEDKIASQYLPNNWHK